MQTNSQSPQSCFWIPIQPCLLSLACTGELQLAPSAVHRYPVDLHTVTSLYCHALVARFCSCISPGQQPEAPWLLVGTYKAPFYHWLTLLISPAALRSVKFAHPGTTPVIGLHCCVHSHRFCGHRSMLA